MAVLDKILSEHQIDEPFENAKKMDKENRIFMNENRVVKIYYPKKFSYYYNELEIYKGLGNKDYLPALQHSGENEDYKYIIISKLQGQSLFDSWDSVKSEAFADNCEIVNMTQSYRTTDEIMTEANKISNHLTGTVSEDVIRHGEDVKYLQCDNDSLLGFVQENLQEHVNKGYHSIAMICKTEEEAKDLNVKLSNAGIIVANVNSDDNKYNGGVCTISCGLAKGLEFDSTILVNVDSNNYKVENDIDMKLLYVAMTRALHETSVLTTGELPHILGKVKGNQLKKHKNKRS